MCRQNEIAIYLVNRYWALIFKKDHGLPMYCNRFALKKVGYTIDMASKSEIFMSFVFIMFTLIINSQFFKAFKTGNALPSPFSLMK